MKTLYPRLLRSFLSALLGLGLCSCSFYWQNKSGLQKPVSPNYSLPLVAEAHKKNLQLYEAKAANFMIATQGHAATKAAAKMFELGGNAIDAAAAASFVISVERPQSTGLGGGGFMLLHVANTNKTIALDFREKAPARAFKNMYLDQSKNVIERASKDGILASGVPGIVAGVLSVQKRYGRLTRQQVMAPAIQLAEKGFRVYPHLAHAIEVRKEVLKKYPSSRKIFFHKNAGPLQVGDLLVQKDLASTLRLISKKGRAGFYRGPVADAIVNEFTNAGGLISASDLRSYNVVYRKPVHSIFRGYEIYSMPPPSSGGVHIIEILNMIENDPLKKWGPSSPKSIHLIASAMQMAFADRARYLGDSDFVKVPVAGLTSKSYAQDLRKNIPPHRARHANEIFAGKPFAYESDDTTHFSIMDNKGNAVSSTQTINGYFGSGIVIPGKGFLMNNEMDDFSAKVGSSNMYGAIGGEANSIQGNKRPLSSMSPTIVMKNGKAILALGTPSGTRILTCVAQVLINYLVYRFPLFESIASIRYHHQWKPDYIRVDPPGFNKRVKKTLEDWDYQIHTQDLGCRVQAVAKEGKQLHGVSDPRGEGMSLGK